MTSNVSRPKHLRPRLAAQSFLYLVTLCGTCTLASCLEHSRLFHSIFSVNVTLSYPCARRDQGCASARGLEVWVDVNQVFGANGLALNGDGFCPNKYDECTIMTRGIPS
jgi:hypothetical protein